MISSRSLRDFSVEPLTSPNFIGAIYSNGAAHLRIWAPAAQKIELVLEGQPNGALELRADGDGYFSATLPTLKPSTLYRYAVDGRGPYPDPCSRYQPRGPHGPSMLVDPTYAWQDSHWEGVELQGQIIYELHVGTFTPEGTFDAALGKLPYLRDLGVTVIELMPVAESPGRWNWGYDGVAQYAPYHVYGDYSALKRFVDCAHSHQLAVILDVVYNHLGPDGNYLSCFSPYYFSKAYRTEWGEAFNFDGEQAQPVRDYVIGNACYWVTEFHLDGFRLDATQSMFDSSQPHIVAELVQHARAVAAPRKLIFIAENEPQRSEHLRPASDGGFGLDGMWNDDFHHSARVALTGRRDGYYFDYAGRAQELISCVKRGFLYQGQYHHRQKQPRGSPLRNTPSWSCIQFLQNHDQVANTLVGHRLHHLTSPARFRAMTALLLLAPQTPLLFMGQEFAASAPFTFFADHHSQLAQLVWRGRREFLAQFEAYATASAQQHIPDPAAESSFLASKLNWSEAGPENSTLLLHRDLIRLRREDELLRQQDAKTIEASTLSESCLLLRWFHPLEEDRLLVINLGADVHVVPAAEPLLAPPRAREWSLLWSSEEPRYGGCGAVNPLNNRGKPGWNIPGECAVLLNATPIKPATASHD